IVRAVPLLNLYYRFSENRLPFVFFTRSCLAYVRAGGHRQVIEKWRNLDLSSLPCVPTSAPNNNADHTVCNPYHRITSCWKSSQYYRTRAVPWSTVRGGARCRVGGLRSGSSRQILINQDGED